MTIYEGPDPKKVEEPKPKKAPAKKAEADTEGED